MKHKSELPFWKEAHQFPELDELYQTPTEAMWEYLDSYELSKLEQNYREMLIISPELAKREAAITSIEATAKRRSYHGMQLDVLREKYERIVSLVKSPSTRTERDRLERLRRDWKNGTCSDEDRALGEKCMYCQYGWARRTPVDCLLPNKNVEKKSSEPTPPPVMPAAVTALSTFSSLPSVVPAVSHLWLPSASRLHSALGISGVSTFDYGQPMPHGPCVDTIGEDEQVADDDPRLRCLCTTPIIVRPGT